MASKQAADRLDRARAELAKLEGRVEQARRERDAAKQAFADTPLPEPEPRRWPSTAWVRVPRFAMDSPGAVEAVIAAACPARVERTSEFEAAELAVRRHGALVARRKAVLERIARLERG